MAPTLPRTTSHVRSSSWPCTSDHFLLSTIKDRLNKLDNIEVKTSSTICHNLNDIKELYEDINSLIQCPLNQQTLSLEQHRNGVEQVLEGSLRLLDVCESTIDAFSLMKESTFTLESSLRRKNNVEDHIKDINGYLMSRKKINKVANKIIKSLPNNVNLLDKDSNLIPVVRMLKEAEIVSLTLTKHVLAYLCQSKCIGKGSSLMAKLMNSKRVQEEDASEIEKIEQVLVTLEAKNSNVDSKMAHDLVKQLATLELVMQEIGECLESISRCLVKTRVSLLNVLSH